MSETTLALRVHARYLDGIVCITRDEPKDSYSIDFFYNTTLLNMLHNPERKYRVKGLYSNQLLEFIDHTIDNLPDWDWHELANVHIPELEHSREGLRTGQCLAFQSF